MKDWIAKSVQVSPHRGMFRVEGVNLSQTDTRYGNFVWDVPLIGQMHRYDVRNAEISPRAARLAKHLYLQATGRA